MQAVEDQAARLWDWGRRHLVWSFIILIVLFVCMWLNLSWTLDLVRFGQRPPIGHDCGGIMHGYERSTARADAALQPLACFWHAYQTCQAATISQTYYGNTYRFGSDSSTNTLTIEWRGNRCAIYGQEELHYSFDRRTTTFLCTQLSKVGDMLQISACDGIAPFALAPLDVPQDSISCGVVGSSPTPGNDTPQKIEACFFAAYQQCLGYKMGYKTILEGVHVERVFYINNHCGLAYQLLSEKGTCASLESRADGLHFSQCGTDGDIFMPNSPPTSS